MSITLPSLSNHIRSHPGMIHPEPAHIAGQCSSHPQNQTPPQPQAQIDTNTIQYFLPGALYTFTISFALGGSGDANNDAAVKNVFLGEFTLHLDNGAREPIFAHVIQGLPEGAWSEGAVNTGMVKVTVKATKETHVVKAGTVSWVGNVMALFTIDVTVNHAQEEMVYVM